MSVTPVRAVWSPPNPASARTIAAAYLEAKVRLRWAGLDPRATQLLLVDVPDDELARVTSMRICEAVGKVIAVVLIDHVEHGKIVRLCLRLDDEAYAFLLPTLRETGAMDWTAPS